MSQNFPGWQKLAVCLKARDGVDVDKLDDIMLYLDLSLKPVVKICICYLHSFVQTPICEIFMRIAIDLVKYCISDDHFQLSETWLGRLAYILCDLKWNVSRVFILFYSPALVFIALVLDMNKKLPFAYKLTVTYLVCVTEHKVFLKT